MSERMVAMNADQHAEVERCIYALMRAGEEQRASKLMTLALAYRFARNIEPPLPDNVIDFSRRVGT